MPWAVDHALCNQRTSSWTQGIDLAPQLFGNITGAVRPCSQRSHRSEIHLLRRRETIEAHAKETSVQICKGLHGRDVNVLHGDRRAWSDRPCVLPPLLEEVRIPLRLTQNLIQRGLARGAFLFGRGRGARAPRRPRIEWTDFRKIEQALGV